MRTPMTKERPPPPPHRTGLRGCSLAPAHSAQSRPDVRPTLACGSRKSLISRALIAGFEEENLEIPDLQHFPLLPPVQQIPAGSGRALARVSWSPCCGSFSSSLGPSGAPSCRQPPSWAPPTHPTLRYREHPQDIPAQPQPDGWRPLTKILPPGPRLLGAPGNILALPPTARGSPQPHPGSNPSSGTAPLAARQPMGTFCTSPSSRQPPRTPQLCPPPRPGCR